VKVTGSVLGPADEDEIRDLVIEFVWRVDHGQADTVHELFTDDGELTLGPNAMRGRGAIVAWGARRAMEARQSLHLVSNIRITASTPDQAQVNSYLVVYVEDPGGPSPDTPLSVGEYRDEFVKTDVGWRFASRRTVTLGQR
jgi:hypothetical protein